jgi:hypothetical protein
VTRHLQLAPGLRHKATGIWEVVEPVAVGQQVAAVGIETAFVPIREGDIATPGREEVKELVLWVVQVCCAAAPAVKPNPELECRLGGHHEIGKFQAVAAHGLKKIRDAALTCTNDADLFGLNHHHFDVGRKTTLHLQSSQPARGATANDADALDGREVQHGAVAVVDWGWFSPSPAQPNCLDLGARPSARHLRDRSRWWVRVGRHRHR